jgi:hypothetical protein
VRWAIEEYGWRFERPGIRVKRRRRRPGLFVRIR